MTNLIEKTIELAASVDQVWRALTDAGKFGSWFRVDIDGPFVAGELSTGRMTVPGFEHVRWEAKIVALKPKTRFAYEWHPYAVDPAVDYSDEPPTLVDFRLEPSGSGTRLTVTESGFDALPRHRRPDALRMNDSGWAGQMRNIAAYVGG